MLPVTMICSTCSWSSSSLIAHTLNSRFRLHFLLYINTHNIINTKTPNKTPIMSPNLLRLNGPANKYNNKTG